MKSVAINKDLSQPPSYSKAVRRNETSHEQSKPIISVHVNMPLILKFDEKECYVCIL